MEPKPLKNKLKTQTLQIDPMATIPQGLANSTIFVVFASP
jgi:hypothetical protein